MALITLRDQAVRLSTNARIPGTAPWRGGRYPHWEAEAGAEAAPVAITDHSRAAAGAASAAGDEPVGQPESNRCAAGTSWSASLLEIQTEAEEFQLVQVCLTVVCGIVIEPPRQPRPSLACVTRTSRAGDLNS
jgi:hypothetical protein